MSQLRFRDYHSVDFATCLALFQTNCPKYFHPDEQAEFEAFLLDLPGPYMLLHHESLGVVGCGGYAFNQSDHSADLCWGIIHGDYHNQGLGKALLQERLDRIQLNPDITHIKLSTSQKTEGFFQHYTFNTEQRIHNGVAPGLDSVAMLQKL